MAKDLVTKGTKDSLTKDPVNHVATQEVAQVTKGRSVLPRSRPNVGSFR